MSVGIALSKGGIDSRAGNLSWQLIDTCNKIAEYNSRLTGLTEEVLTGPDIGYTSGEVAVLKSAFTEMTDGIAILNGTAAQAGAAPHNYLVFTYQLIADMV